MNIRVKFRKYGCLRFIGHLDVMRYFQKAIRRADIDIRFSEGFSPHMIMSFASPLGVGITSDGEYMDISVNSSPSSAEAVSRLNAVMAEGIDVVSWKLLPDDGKNAMSIVAAADYELRFREGSRPAEGWQEKFREFLAQPEIQVTKKTKKGTQELDIRPWIYDARVENDVIFLRLSAGSVHNLKPSLLIQEFCAWAGREDISGVLLTHRVELYARTGTKEEERLAPLEELGDDIGAV